MPTKKLKPEFDDGRWIVKCPTCNGAELAIAPGQRQPGSLPLSPGVFDCHSCGHHDSYDFKVMQ